MAYLINNDFLRLIQETQLNQVTSSSTIYLTLAENAAQEKFKEFLSPKFDLSQEFTNTTQYDPTITYSAANRVYLNAPAYSNSSTYAIGALTLYNGQVYQCNTLISVGESFTPGHWSLLGNQYDMFYGAYPTAPAYSASSTYAIGVFTTYNNNVYQCSVAINVPEAFTPAHWTQVGTRFASPIGFNIKKGAYLVGDIVFWKNILYVALQPSVFLSHQEKIQFYRTGKVPFPNVFPDDPINGPLAWKSIGTYLIPAGSVLNPLYFTYGDNRNQEVLTHYINLAVNFLYSRLAPKSMPDQRDKAYKEAMLWLNMAMEGKIAVSLIPIQPPEGMRFRWGSNEKLINSY